MSRAETFPGAANDNPQEPTSAASEPVPAPKEVAAELKAQVKNEIPRVVPAEFRDKVENRATANKLSENIPSYRQAGRARLERMSSFLERGLGAPEAAWYFVTHHREIRQNLSQKLSAENQRSKEWWGTVFSRPDPRAKLELISRSSQGRGKFAEDYAAKRLSEFNMKVARDQASQRMDEELKKIEDAETARLKAYLGRKDVSTLQLTEKQVQPTPEDFNEAKEGEATISARVDVLKTGEDGLKALNAELAKIRAREKALLDLRRKLKEKVNGKTPKT